MSTVSIRRALLSVSDKTYLEDFARGLAGFGVELLATGGTADALKRAGIPFRAIETFTGNPEAFDGRMKTISFKLESAILFDRANAAHVAQAETLGVEPIDMVVCNFYPFEEAVAKGAGDAELTEQIDIGGPTMVRAAAKNFRSVAVVVSPDDYQPLLAEIRGLGGGLGLETRRRLMAKAFERVTLYDQAIFEAFARKPLRYGENPHQAAFFVPYAKAGAIRWELADSSGVELSYNNIVDAQAAFGAVRDVRLLAQSKGNHASAYASAGVGTCAIVKHNNPCGLATGHTIEEAFERAWAGDPVSAFGGVVALSAPLTAECARLMEERFIEVLLAPGFEEGALEHLRRKKKKLRVLQTRGPSEEESTTRWGHADIEGGYLLQQPDEGFPEEPRTVTKKKFPAELQAAARFGIVAAKWIQSNAIAIVRRHPDGGLQLVGMGSGQPNRVDAIRRLAIPKMRDVLKAAGADTATVIAEECVLVSDAFFPFPDSVEEAYAAGLRHIVQPGGSIRDAEVISAADHLGVAMAFTGRRHFRH